MTSDLALALALELRVLTGLQAGAALPLQEPLLVGSGEEADLLLLDEGIAGTQSRLAREASGEILLEVLADGVILQDGRRLASGESFRLVPGQAFQVGPAWLVVKSEDAPWDPWTPPPLEAGAVEPMPSGDDAKIESSEASPSDEAVAVVTGAAASPASKRHTGAATRKRASGRLRRHRPAGRMRMIGSLIVAAGLLSTMLGVAALVRQASGTEHPGDTATRASVHSPSPASDSAPVPAEASTPASASASTFEDGRTPDAPPAVSTLSPSEHGPEAMGKHLVVQVPGEEDVVLPFDIAEVLMGLSSHVILNDGRRLYPGDHVGPWRLVAIRRGVLVFDGPRKVQVAW